MLSSFAHLVWKRAQRDRLLRKGDRILLAVSGGPDSMALLEVMRELAPAKGLSLHVAHIHHMLRASDADADRQFVKQYCRFVRVPFSDRYVDVPAHRRKAGGSVEETARALRYEALERLRAQKQMDMIATGHHADDQTETLLMRIVRGTDVKGLAGILPRLEVPPVIRPLLHASRAEIMAYLEDRRAPYRIDRTNEDTLMMRNMVRHEVIPRLLRSGQRQLVNAIPGFADVVRRFGDHLQRVVPLLLGERTEMQHGHLLVRTATLIELSPGLRRSFVGLVLSGLGVDLSRARIERVIGLATNAPGKRIVFRSAGIRIVRDRAHLAFGPIPARTTSSTRLRTGQSVRMPGAVVHADGPARPPERFGPDQSIAWIDAGRVTGDLRVRVWKAGDRIQPLGMQGRSKKVSDVLRDARVPLYYKESVPVVTSRGRIVWVCGVRADERFKVTPGTARAVKLSCIPLP